MATEVRDDAPQRTKKDDNVDDMAIVGKSILINCPRADLFSYWQHFANLPSFMDNLDSVEPAADGTARWTIKAPLDRTVTIETRQTEVVADTSIGWMSTETSEIKTQGRVDFADAPAGRGTVVTLEIAYEPPAGELGRVVAKLFTREPNVQTRQELKRFKMLMETGEIARGPDQLKKDE